MIVDYLDYGAENAMSANDLSEIMGCPASDVFHLVEDARKEGWMIIGKPGPGGGYYFPKVDTDFFRYCGMLEQRVYNAISVYTRAMSQASQIEPGSSMSKFCERYSRDARQKMHRQIDEAHRIRRERR